MKLDEHGTFIETWRRNGIGPRWKSGFSKE
jgi:hypothetical protein